MADRPRILWADDEIDLLRSHILFLEQKGYRVVGVTNGPDAISRVQAEHFDLVFLDEQMPGMGGLDTLEGIKEVSPELPVVMITKSEEEHLMEEAIGQKISDYLIKPVNPRQILMTCKRLLEQEQIREEKLSQQYLQQFGRLSMQMQEAQSYTEWIDIYRSLMHYATELEKDEGIRQVIQDQFREANTLFAEFVEQHYPDWIASASHEAGQERPVLSHEVLPTFVFPLLEEQKPVYFFLIDCMRYDQWMEFERLLYPLFDIQKSYHFGLIPTATPYARNAIFSGLLPRDLARRYPEIWVQAEHDEHSRNRHEEQLLKDFLERRNRPFSMHYEKVLVAEEGQELVNRIQSFTSPTLVAVVVNFVDILAHSRTDSAVLKELAPDERAYRALTRTWFEHSWLYRTFERLAEKGATVVVTSDHGAVRCLRPSKVIGDRETSTGLRYKLGRNVRVDDERHALNIRKPLEYGLPQESGSTNYVIAREDYYFVYPTNYHRFVQRYRDTFQHGGISMEEMILPVAVMRAKHASS